MDTESKAVDVHMEKLDLKIADLGAVTGRLKAKLESTNHTLQVFSHKQEKMENTLLDMNRNYEKLVTIMAQMIGDFENELENKSVEGSMSNQRSSSVLSLQESSVKELGNHVRGDKMGNTRLPKVDFPHFGGEGPSEWLRKADEYFQIHQVSEELRLGIAKMYLEGRAYVWFYGFIANHPGANWSLFSDELCRRFSETTGEEVVETFSKIKQLGTMKEHQESEESEPEEGQGGEEVMEISISALVGSLKHKNIRVPGMIKGRKISILIDSESAHSFVDERLIKELNYATNEANVMTIRVANGDKIESKAVCQPLVWRVHDWEFQFNLRALKLGSSDMVLGVNWMSQFSPIVFYFEQGFIKFKHHNEEVELRNEILESPVKMKEIKKIERMFDKGAYGAVGQLCFLIENNKRKIPGKITEVIEQFPKVFEEPKGLPPPRLYEHNIARTKGVHSFRVRPYKCSFIQKTDIKRLVVEIRIYKLNQQLKENLSQASTRAKLYADKKILEQSLVGGDWVFLKLLPYAQKSVEHKAYHKLSAKYFSSYQIIKKIREVAYQLALPEGSKIHPTFHVYLLKKKLGNKIIPTLQLLEGKQSVSSNHYPPSMLQSSLVQLRKQMAVQWRVHWSDLLLENATWEDADLVKHEFSISRSWGQDQGEGEGCHEGAQCERKGLKAKQIQTADEEGRMQLTELPEWLKPVDDPHVDLIATVAGSLDHKPEERIVGKVRFHWQSDVEDPRTFVDLFVSHTEPILLTRSCAYYEKLFFGAFGIFPVLLKQRVSSEDYGVMGLRYGSSNLSVGATVIPFFVGDEIPKSAWLVSKMGRLTAGVQYEPTFGSKDGAKYKNLANWSCAIGYGLGSGSPLSPSFDFGLELAKNSQFIASFYQHVVVQRRVKNPLEENEIVGITNYIDFGFELQTSIDADKSSNNIQESTFQVAASWQANKNFLLKGKVGPLSSSIALAFKSWWKPSFTFSMSAVRNRTKQETAFGFGVRVDNIREASYQRADPNYVMLTPNKEHLAEGIHWKIGKRPVLQSDVNSGNFDDTPKELRPLGKIL